MKPAHRRVTSAMGRPRATAAASRSRRANPKPSFLSPLSPATAATRKRAGSGSSPSSPTSSTDLTFVSSAYPKPAPKSRSSKRTTRAKPAARSPFPAPPRRRWISAKACDAVEVAGTNVLSTSSAVTTGLVSHKYGEKAASATNEGLDAIGPRGLYSRSGRH